MRKLNKLSRLLILAILPCAFLALAFLVLTPSALAIDQGNIDLTVVKRLPRFTLAQAVLFTVRILIIGAFILALIFLLLGGIRWITSGGDAKALEGAKGMVTASIVGLLIILASFSLIALLEFFFDVKIISCALQVPTLTQSLGGCP